MLVIVSGDDEVFFRVEVRAELAELTSTLPKAKVAGVSVAAGNPVPVIVRRFDPAEVLFVTVTVLFRMALVRGLKVRVSVQLSPAFKVVGQL